MKKCPECGRTYTDETLNFCLDDGAALLYGPAPNDEARTAVLDSAPTSEAPKNRNLSTVRGKMLVT